MMKYIVYFFAWIWVFVSLSIYSIIIDYKATSPSSDPMLILLLMNIIITMIFVVVVCKIKTIKPTKYLILTPFFASYALLILLVVRVKKCPHCLKNISKKDLYCKYCGTKQ